MPCGKLFSDTEKGQILAHAHHGMSKREIATTMSRSRDAITRFLNRPHPSQQTPFKPRNKKLSQQTVRRIICEASKTKKSAAEIKISLQVPVTVRRIQQILSGSTHLRYRWSLRAPYSLQRHK